MKKQFLAVLLTLAMLLSVLPASTLAVEDEGGITSLDAATEEEACPTDGCTLEKGHEGDCDVPAVPYDHDSDGDGEYDSWNISSDDNDPGDVVYAYVTENSTGYTLHFGGKGDMRDFTTPKNTLTGKWDYATNPWSGYQNPYYKKITDLVFEEGNAITSIGNATIYGENNLTVDVVLPGTITSIGELGFIVTPIKSIKFPDGLTSIGSRAFERCAGLTEIDLSNTQITALDGFNGCANLSSVQLPKNLASLKTGAFKDCTSLTSIELPDSLTQIGGSAFQGSGLTSIDLNSVTEIAYDAFTGCENLEEIDFGDGEQLTIGWEAFKNTGVTELTIPENVTVGSYAFAACPELTKVTVYGTFASNSYYHFQNCGNLETAIIDVSGAIAQGAFDGCENLKDVTIGDKVTTIGAWVFRGCTSLTELTFPATTDTNNTGGSSTIYKVTVKEPSTSLTQHAYINNGSWGTAYGDATLVDWYTESGTAASNDLSIIGRHRNQAGTFYAVFSNEVTFEANGGSGSISESITSYFAPGLAEGDSFTISDKCTLPSEGVTLNGYTLSGWNTEADGSGKSYTPGEAVAVTNQEITTLYAQWKANTYTISFSGGDGTSGSTDSVTATYDQPVTLTANGFTKSGYHFAGWATTEGADTAAYSDGATVENLTAVADGNVTLYAVWTDKQVLTPDKSVQTKTYNGNPQAFTLESGYTIAYQQNGSTVTAPTNAGSYDVVISHAGDDTYAPYPETTISGGLVITPATLTAPELTKYTATATSITVTAPALPDGASKVQYSIDDGVKWQNINVFSGLTSGTTYSVIARFVADASGNYADSANSTELSATTNSTGGGGGSSSGGSATYPVTVNGAKNGTVTVSPKNAAKGATVTVTVKPNSGYELDDLTVTDRNGDAVKVKSQGGDKYTFTMPAGKVTVEAAFTKVEEPSKVSFADVSTGAYYYDAVAWAVENGVTSGTTATTFSPNAPCTRAQTVTFLWRAAGSPTPRSSANPFTDVQPGAYYYDAVLWAVENGITAGTTATTFSPDATVTRGQTVTFQYRAAGSPAANGGSFADVAADAYYAPAVRWAVANGITNGTSATTFSPDAPCTRAQIVTFLYRACVD